MTRRLTILLLTLGITAITYAQDVQRFAERQVIGTARYVAMGGAMTAIGGDPSAALDNPAGLGLYRRSEIMLTLDETIDRTYQSGTNDRYGRSRFAAPQISAIWSLGNPQRIRGLIYSNFMLSSNRLATYNRDIHVEGKDLQKLNTICLKTNGLPEQYLQNKPWDDTEVGWLSILGYETYLINPAEDDLWTPAIELIDGTLSISETGSYDQYTLSWAGNINNQWYIGLALNVPTLSYTKNVTHYETNRTHSAELKSMYHLSGVGVSGSIGIIYRPIRALRIGASFLTPTTMSLSVQTESDMNTRINGQSYTLLTPASGVISSDITSPLRSSISLAAQIGNEGMIAVQYDYTHAIKNKYADFAPMDDVHTLRIGAEAQAYRGLFINAGYVYESSFRQDDPVWVLAYNEIRTDMDYRYTTNSQYASLGLGYRSDAVVAQVAYQYRWQAINQYATELQALPMELNTLTHRIVATLAWRF